MDELRIPPDHLIASFCVAKRYDSELTAKALGKLKEKGARYVDVRYLPWPFCGSTPPPPEARWQTLNHRADKADDESKMIQLMDVVQTDNDVEVFFDVKFAGGLSPVMFSMKELDWKTFGVAITACNHEILETGGDDAKRANLKTFRGLGLVLYEVFKPLLGQIAVDQWIRGYGDYDGPSLPWQWAVYGPTVKSKLPPEFVKELSSCHFIQNLSDGGIFFSPKPWLKNDATAKDAQNTEKLRKMVQSLKVTL